MKRNKLGDSWFTYVELDGEELDNVEVNYDASPAEPSVGFGGDLEIESVIYQGKDIFGRLTAEEVDNLIERTSEWINTYHCEDQRY